MSSSHQKHPKLARVIKGHYHKSEWAIYGTTCGRINEFMTGIQEELSDFNFLIIDADHKTSLKGGIQQVGVKQWSLNNDMQWNEYDDRLFSWNSDAVLVNGNHYPAQKQIVFINPEKKASLKKRMDQLTHIDMIVLHEDHQEIYDFLEEKITKETKTFLPNQWKKIGEHLKKSITANLPSLKALILAGGKSSRMGMDKSQIAYQENVPQEVHLAQLCQEMGIEAYISKEQSYESSEISGFPVLQDRMLELGAFGGILTAFMFDPNAAWMVLACDLPLLDKTILKQLIHERKTNKQASCFRKKGNEFPEPLIAIYEPSIYPRMLRFLALGYACPRKVLINSDVQHIDTDEFWKLHNANTPEERDQAFDKLKV